MFKQNDNLFADITDTQSIFIDLEQGIFYVLPPFANTVFRLLISGKTIEETKQVCSTIDQVPLDYNQRIDSIINNLKKFNIIIPSEITNCTQPFNIYEEIVQDMQEDNFSYDITPSTDVQKLLMDDPIHDVSLNGWSPVVK